MELWYPSEDLERGVELDNSFIRREDQTLLSGEKTKLFYPERRPCVYRWLSLMFLGMVMLMDAYRRTIPSIYHQVLAKT